MKIFLHLGKREPNYREIMHRQQDICIDGRTIPAHQVVIADQTHSRLVHICQPEDRGAGFGTHPQIPLVDGLITNIPGQFLLIRTADCTPVLLYDTVKMVVAALHSGREGTRKNIVAEACQKMQTQFGCEHRNIIAYIGAGISHAHYEVSQEIYDQFQSSLIDQGFTPKTDIPRHLDIRNAIFQQLLRAGITFRNIEQVSDCTYSNPEYHSYRREGTKNRQINLIGIIDE